MNATEFTVKQCFLWAKAITHCSDYRSLTYVFLDLLKGFSWIDSVQAYEIYRKKKKRSAKNSPQKTLIRKFPLDFSGDPDDHYCDFLENKEFANHIELITLSQTKIIAVLPISSDIGPERAIVLEGCFEARAIDLLNELLCLYHNQVLLHDHKERDVLTRLPNRQSLDDRLLEVCEFYRGNQHKFNDNTCAWLAMLDIDHFKSVNDTFGHLYGDEVLLHFGQLMENSFRYIDFIFRFGGEEFVVILNQVTKNDARKILNRFRADVEQYNFPLVGQVTVSIGATQIQSHDIVVPSLLLDNADKALYSAKDHGRNQVILFEDMPPNPKLQQAANNIEFF
ncbi:MAG: GGDEF domain-containing protein [Methylococcaceae bacterium]|jgi:diguanylate cyclase (GGDEF)-like protein